MKLMQVINHVNQNNICLYFDFSKLNHERHTHQSSTAPEISKRNGLVNGCGVPLWVWLVGVKYLDDSTVWQNCTLYLLQTLKRFGLVETSSQQVKQERDLGYWHIGFSDNSFARKTFSSHLFAEMEW